MAQKLPIIKTLEFFKKIYPLHIMERIEDDYKNSDFYDPSRNFAKNSSIMPTRLLQFEMLLKLGNSIDTVSLYSETAFMSCVYEWRKHKKCFRIDEELINQFKTQLNDECTIPTSAILNLPYSAFYVEAPVYKEADGFIVKLDEAGQIAENNYPCIWLQFVSKTGNKVLESVMCPISNNITIDEDLLAYDDSSAGKARFEKEYTMVEFMKLCIFILLYIISEDADIKSSSLTKNTYKPRNLKDPITDKFREVEYFDVGYEIGDRIRRERKLIEESIEVDFGEVPETSIEEPKVKKERKPIKPHMRKAHWHHFWTGSKEDPDNRQLVVRWVPPTFVKPRSNK